MHEKILEQLDDTIDSTNEIAFEVCTSLFPNDVRNAVTEALQLLRKARTILVAD